MIDIAKERPLIPLNRVPQTEELSQLRPGKRIHVSTVYRWWGQGLETILVGGTRCTTLPALQRFFDARTAARSASRAGRHDAPATPALAPAPAIRSSVRMARDAERAGRELDRLGV